MSVRRPRRPRSNDDWRWRLTGLPRPWRQLALSAQPTTATPGETAEACPAFCFYSGDIRRQRGARGGSKLVLQGGGLTGSRSLVGVTVSAMAEVVDVTSPEKGTNPYYPAAKK